MKYNALYRKKLLFPLFLLVSVPVIGPSIVAAVAPAAMGQSDNAIVNEPSAADDLRDAILRIGRSPTDSDALYDAGEASLRIGDPAVALDFFKRAERINPSSGRIKSGMAMAQLNLEDPVEALRLFDLAATLGVPARDMAFDRGLAYDLIGNFSRAQQEYSLASASLASNDLTIRQAISFSLAGNHDYADGLLNPLLRANDPAAWRARSFLLAARGDTKESYKIAQGFLQARDAENLRPYLRSMDKLTGAQQAAAVHFGNFPASTAIGKDGEAIRVASANTNLLNDQASDRLTPVGKPLGQNQSNNPIKKKLSKREQRRADAANAKILAAQEKANAANIKIAAEQNVKVAAVLPPPIASNSVSDLQNRAAVQGPVQTENAISKVIPEPASQADNIEPRFASLPDIKTADRNTPGITAPDTVIPDIASSADRLDIDSDRLTRVSDLAPAKFSDAAVTDSAARGVDLGAFISSLEIPEEDQRQSAVVDLDAIKAEQLEERRIEKLAQERANRLIAQREAAAKKAAEKAAAEKEAQDVKRAEAEKNKARYWVQLATGRDGNALRFDYRRLSRKQPDLFSGKSGATSKWGETTRLVVGPFDNLAAAKEFESKFRKGGGDGFVWRSGNGTLVTPLE